MEGLLLFDGVNAEVSSQLNTQAGLGVQITRQNEVPEAGPTNRGVWLQIPEVTAVFADLKGSTKLNATESPQTAALAYTYFIRAMAVVLERFSAKYVDIQGDGIFVLFSGRGSPFLAAAAAITMKTLVNRDRSPIPKVELSDRGVGHKEVKEPDGFQSLWSWVLASSATNSSWPAINRDRPPRWRRSLRSALCHLCAHAQCDTDRTPPFCLPKVANMAAF